jgi:hypothetical protein
MRARALDPLIGGERTIESKKSTFDGEAMESICKQNNQLALVQEPMDSESRLRKNRETW